MPISTVAQAQANDVLDIAADAGLAATSPSRRVDGPDVIARRASWIARLICRSGLHSFEHGLHQRRYVCRHCGRSDDA